MLEKNDSFLTYSEAVKIIKINLLKIDLDKKLW